MRDKRLIGVDFGTTNTCVCYTRFNPQKDTYDEPQPIEFDRGSVVRSALLLDPTGKQVVRWGDMVYDSPDYLRQPADVREEFKLQIGSNPEAELCTTLLFGQVLHWITRRLNVSALNAEQEQVVIGVPAQWTRVQGEATRRAIEAAGFPSPETVVEPVGALLYHSFLGDVQYSLGADNTLVVDFGGGTIDFVVVRVPQYGQLPEAVHAYGETYGGKDFDRAIMEYMIRHYWHREPPSLAHKLELLQFARQFKEECSRRWARGEKVYRKYCRVTGVEAHVEMTVEAFESDEVCGPLIRRLANILLNGVRGSQQALSNVHQVILTGGSARWYFVKDAIQTLIGCPVLVSANPEQTIARGLALARADFRIPSHPTTALEVQPSLSSTSETSLQVADPLPVLPLLDPLSATELAVRRQQANRVITRYMATAGGTAIILSPVIGSSAALSALEIKLVLDIGKVYGYELSTKQGIALIAGVLATGTVLKVAVSEALTFVPGVGWVAKGAVAAAAVKAMGETAIRYFEKRRQAQVPPTPPLLKGA